MNGGSPAPSAGDAPAHENAVDLGKWSGAKGEVKKVPTGVGSATDPSDLGAATAPVPEVGPPRARGPDVQGRGGPGRSGRGEGRAVGVFPHAGEPTTAPPARVRRPVGAPETDGPSPALSRHLRPLRQRVHAQVSVRKRGAGARGNP